MAILQYRLGKLPARVDRRTLRLERYALDLPTPPASVDYTPAVLALGGFPMLLNDSLGDCAIAGPGHLEQTWSDNAGVPFAPADAQILAAYEAIGGYDPTNPGSDQGCNLLDVMNAWRQTGIAGNVITAYAQARPSDQAEMKNVICLFGGAMLGVQLPDSVCQGDLLANPWDDTVTDPPSPYNGHCVVVVGYTQAGLSVVTWGAVKFMSWKFLAAYADEAYAVLSPQWFNPTSGKDPAGLDLPSLLSDLQAVTA